MSPGEKVSAESKSRGKVPRKLVVAGLLWRTQGESREILISQRKPEQSLGGYWEFPGGKVEAGEVPEEALRRELQEELGIQVRVGRVWDVLSHCYPDFDLLMLIYECQLAKDSPSPRCVDVADFAWVTTEQMDSYEILPADRPLVERLQVEGLPAHTRPRSPSQSSNPHSS